MIEFCGYLFVLAAVVWAINTWGQGPPSNPWIG